MESVIDVVRMQLLSSANSKRNQWQSMILIAILSNYRRLWEQVLSVLLRMTKLRMFKRFLKKPPEKKLIADVKEKKEKLPKTVIKLRFSKGEIDNKILKEILNRHAIEFDTITLKNPNSWHVIQPKTIILAEDIYFSLDFTERPPPPQPVKKKKSKKKSDSDSSSSEDEETTQPTSSSSSSPTTEVELHETRGQVYSYERPLKEVLDFLHSTYAPPEPKPVPVKVTAITKKTVLYNMFVGRTTKFDDKNDLRGEILEFTISKSLDNIFLEPETREMLLSQVTRFNDPNWYAERGLPRTLGILLHGQPGCGKTSFIKTMCAHLKRRVLIVDFKLVKTIAHLRKIFSGNFREDKDDGDVHRFTKDNTIYVFEDFDCMSSVFMDRNLKKEHDKEQIEEAQKEAEFHKEMLMLSKLEKIEKLKNSRKKNGTKKHKKKKKKSRDAEGGKKRNDEEKNDSDSSSESSSDDDSRSKKKKEKDAKEIATTAEENGNGNGNGGATISYGSGIEENSFNDIFSIYDNDYYKGFGTFEGERRWGGWRPEKQVSLADFLELLDGIIEMDGRIIIMTTNQRDKMDSALVRPGRIDLDLELCPPSRELIAEIFAHMYKHLDLDTLKELFGTYYDRIPHKIVSTARVINCFMYTKPELGLKALVESGKSCQTNGGADVDVNLLFKEEDKQLPFEEAWKRIEMKNGKGTDEISSNVIDIWDIMKNVEVYHCSSSCSKSDNHRSILDITNTSPVFETNFSSTLSGTPPQWYKLDFRHWTVKVHSYSIRKRPGSDYTLLNWNIEGSNSGEKDDWQVISAHRDDHSIVENDLVTFKVESHTFYRMLRIYSMGPSHRQGGETTRAHFSLVNWQIMGEVLKL